MPHSQKFSENANGVSVEFKCPVIKEVVEVPGLFNYCPFCEEALDGSNCVFELPAELMEKS